MFIRSAYSAHTRSASGTEHHHHTADMVRGRRDRGSADRFQPGLRSLAFELVRRQRVDPDQVLFDGPPSVALDRLPAAFEHEAGSVLADRGGLARIDDSLELADIRQVGPGPRA